MFTKENSTFAAADRAELNKALTTLLGNISADASEMEKEQAEGSYSDILNNAWFEDATADELVAAVSK